MSYYIVHLAVGVVGDVSRHKVPVAAVVLVLLGVPHIDRPPVARGQVGIRSDDINEIFL